MSTLWTYISTQIVNLIGPINIFPNDILEESFHDCWIIWTVVSKTQQIYKKNEKKEKKKEYYAPLVHYRVID